MILARIEGQVVSTMKHPAHRGHKLLVVQPIDAQKYPIGASFLAHDAAQAGVGDIVLAEREGNTARQLLGTKDDPFHAVIVGIVDRIDEEIEK